MRDWTDNTLVNKIQPGKDFEYVKGQCDFCGVISVYKFAGKRCLESCEACGDWFTNITRVADFNE